MLYIPFSAALSILALRCDYQKRIFVYRSSIIVFSQLGLEGTLKKRKERNNSYHLVGYFRSSLEMDFSDPEAKDSTSASWESFFLLPAPVELDRLPGWSAVPASMFTS